MLIGHYRPYDEMLTVISLTSKLPKHQKKKKKRERDREKKTPQNQTKTQVHNNSPFPLELMMNLYDTKCY